MCNDIEQPNSLFGYIIQIPRALILLINNSGTVYLEKYDDIIIEQNNKISIIEQVKDVKGNITNNSIEFWKTISNWIKLRIEYPDKFTTYTRYILSVNSHKNIKNDSFLQKCIDANNIEAATDTYEYIRANFNSDSKSLKEKFLDFSKIENKDIAIQIIQNFEYVEPEIDFYNDSLNEVTKNYKDVNSIENLQNRIIAWVMDKMYNADKKNLKRDFKLVKEDFNSFIYKDKKLKLALEEELTTQDYQSVENAYFVKQLNLIEHSEEALTWDKRDFLRWRNTATKENKLGRIAKEDFMKSYQNIYEKWVVDRTNIFRISASDTDITKGYRLYQNTINQEIQIGTVSFEDNKIEIARGVCNYLANNNPETINYTIGWHPNFKKLLSEVEDDDKTG
uniref:hypothetical protein n=1 Tax=Candidatus Stercorousia sp. TaxID=3048886 RepID=UPI004027E9EE